jgi:hypothetical protein
MVDNGIFFTAHLIFFFYTCNFHSSWNLLKQVLSLKEQLVYNLKTISKFLSLCLNRFSYLSYWVQVLYN